MKLIIKTMIYTGPVLVSRLMTQRWLDIDSQWTVDEHVSGHSALRYKYRVVCEEHYHGKGCSKWCSARDDNFGHYTCNKNGDQTICSPGCKGTCTEPNTCICSMGWKGKKCDECVVYPGCLHGSCTKPWECNCQEGWGGLFCNQDLNYCTNHQPCKNGATCFNTAPGSYSCKCPPGFNGTNCEIPNDSCALNPCKSGGTCIDTGDEGFVCQCRSSFKGRYCEISGQSCLDKPCKHGAPCTDTPSGFQCHCPNGYEGLTCERSVNDCASSPCKNGGSCVDEHETFRCVCPVGFTGPSCQTNIDNCATNPCLNGGKCIDGINSYQCQCQPGFVGDLCQTNVDDCAIGPCGNGGTCIDKINDFECKCRKGWMGKHCYDQAPVSPCTENPCDNGGACKEDPELAVGYRCLCPSGLLGPRCTIPHHRSQIHSSPESITRNEPMSTVQIVLIVVFSIAVPLLAFFFITVIICMKRRRRREHCRHDEEARRQNEQNTVHNAVNKNNMIFNSLDYPPKPLNTEVSAIHLPSTHKKVDTDDYPPSKKNYSLENAYSIAPTRSTKTLNTDVSNLSLASRLEKDLDAYGLSRNSPIVVVDPPGSVNISKTPDPHLPRTHSHSDVFLKRMNNSNSNSNTNIAPTSSPTGGGLCTSSTHTLTSVCTPSTCTTPSSVYVIEEHTDENYIATEV
ncbi:Neurogenic locus protein delta [Armadillidium vulgare]|nr:Neurogenic locus protein delta [Armadillidium vulgare]